MAKIGSKVRGVTVEISSGVIRSHFIGDGGSAIEHYGGPQIKITGTRTPISMKKEIVGFIMEYEIKEGRIIFRSEMKDSPETRAALKINSAIGFPLSRVIKRHEKAKAARSRR